MKFRSTLLRLAALASTLALSSCTNSIFSGIDYIYVTISPRPVSVPVNGSIVFGAITSNGVTVPTWSLLDAADTTSAGTLTPVSGPGDFILYTAPPTPPIYSAAAGSTFTQGAVTVVASLPAAPAGVSITNDSVTFFITAPSVSVNLSPTAVTVPLGSTVQFSGYAVGAVNNLLTWQVNGVTGGSTAFGTIGATGLYIAPSILPMTGNTVTVTMVSQADTTKTATAVVTLQ